MRPALSAQRLNDRSVTLQMNLYRLAAIGDDLLTNGLTEQITARNGKQFRLEALTKNPSLAIALSPCQSTTAQRAVDVDIPIR